MKAIIEVINLEMKMVGASIGGDEYVVFEMIDDAVPKLGDVIGHDNFGAMGRKSYWNETQGIRQRVLVRNLVGSLNRVQEQCFVKPEPTPPLTKSKPAGRK